MSTYDLIRVAHIGVGSVALATFWIAGLARKGSAVHKAAGKIYLVTMAAIVATSVPMTLIIARSGRTLTAAFLGYLVVIVATAVWNSWRAIRDKKNFAAYTGRIYKALAWLNIASGVAVLALGLARGVPLFAGFSLIGVIGGGAMLRFARQPPANPRWWLVEHLGAMLGNGVATHIAFLAIGLPRLVPALNTPAWMYTAWFAPVLIALAARLVLTRRYLPAPPRSSPQAPRTALMPLQS
jgi:hypothetical protein